ncbi:MAG: hypothetical protein LBS17_00585 [Actinomycetes bacterium]|jgi:hypothetical protein|nr:hypothetical protein [Actinomycetes bacterium]
MKTQHPNYPHPVLSPLTDDYEDSSFIVTVEERASGSRRTIDFGVSYSLVSFGLQHMVQHGTATVAVQLISSKTCMRRVEFFQPHETAKTISVRKSDIRDRLEFRGMIIASTPDDSFQWGEHNPDYFEEPFSINRGDILAIETGTVFDFEPVEEKKSASSIMIVKSSSDHDSLYLNTDKDRLELCLPIIAYDHYQELRNEEGAREYLIASVVYPAIVEAIHAIQNDQSDELEDKRWCKSIVLQTQNKGLSLSDEALTLADRLLGNITRTSLESLKQVIESLGRE